MFELTKGTTVYFNIYELWSRKARQKKEYIKILNER